MVPVMLRNFVVQRTEYGDFGAYQKHEGRSGFFGDGGTETSARQRNHRLYVQQRQRKLSADLLGNRCGISADCFGDGH